MDCCLSRTAVKQGFVETNFSRFQTSHSLFQGLSASYKFKVVQQTNCSEQKNFERMEH